MSKSISFLLFVSLFLAGCFPDNKGFDLKGDTLTSITVTPAFNRTLVGATQAYEATGTFSDGSTQDITDSVSWTSSDEAVAKVTGNGVVEALAEGRAVITASKGGLSGGGALTVFSETITELVVVPIDAAQPAGTTLQYEALVYLASRSSVNVTDQVTWSSSDTSIISIDEAGLASFVVEGSATVTATLLETSTSVSATVTSAVLEELLVDPIEEIAPAGTQIQYTATGIYSDGSSADLTTQANWSTANSSIATVDNTGLASLLSNGETQVTAAVEGFSANAELTVTGATIEALQILPAVISAPVGTSGQLVLVAAYSDGKVANVASTAVWESDDSSIALVQSIGESAGFTQLIKAGTTRISASFDGLDAVVDVTVTDAVLTDIILEPVNTSQSKGYDVQYIATGIYSDGSRENLEAEVTWQSSDSTIAIIDNLGVAQTLEVGITAISASKDGIVGETALTVTDAELTGVNIIPGSVSKPAGQFQKLTALAQYSDGSIADVTIQSTWNSSDEAIAFVVPQGEFAGTLLGRVPGNVDVTVNYQGQTDSIPVTVTAAVLTSIIVEPINISIANGRNQQYTATGLYSDNTSQPLTDQVSWQSSDTGVATIDLLGLATSLADGETTISASLAGFDDQTTLTITPAQVTSMQIFPADIEAPLGAQGQLTAVATYTDGSTADVTAESTWESTDSAIAYVVNDGENAGFALATGEGSAQISANFSATMGTAPVVITAAVLQEINIEPVDASIPKGVEQIYTATGIYSDNTSADLTDLVNWQSSESDIATIDASGLAKAESEGATVIQAEYQGIIGQTNLTVTAAALTGLQITPSNPTAPAGTNGPLQAVAYYSDLTTKNVTTESTWVSSNSDSVVVSPSGDTAGFTQFIAEGTATLTANFQGQSADTLATVTAAVLTGIFVDPVLTEVANGVDVQYQAYGIFSDGSSGVLTEGITWRSSVASVAVISPDGLAETQAPGATTITASFDAIIGRAALIVTAASITEVSIVQSDFDLPLGNATQLNAVAYFTDGTSLDITASSTWATGDSNILTVSNASPTQGEVLARSLGTTSVSINYQGFNDAINGTATSAVLERIDLQPANLGVAKGLDVQYTATGIYSDDSNEDLTSLADWQSSNTTTATIDGNGKATALNIGNTTITAAYNGISAQTPLTVTAAVVDSVQVTPAALVEPAGTSGQFTATAYYSDSTSDNVTTIATWSSSNTTVVAVAATGENAGLAELLVPGTAAVTASFQGVSDSVEVTVTDAELVSIEVNPAVATVPEGIPVRYEAIGRFTDGSSSPINEDVTWQSSDTGVAVITPKGIAFTQGVGDTIISASVGEDEEVVSVTDADAVLTVTNAIPIALQMVPGKLVEPAGTSGQQFAIAFFSDLTAQDVTTQSTWVSSDSTIVNVVASGEDAGYTQLLKVGFATLTATYEGVSRTVDVEVTDAVLESIEISPKDQSVARGVEVQYSATGIFSDGTSSSIDSDVVWQSSDTTVATISEDGLANTLGDEARDISSTQITASFDGITASTPLTVTDAVVLTMQITPANLTEPAGTSGQFTATATYTDRTSKDVTTISTWSSSDTSIVEVVATGESAGLASLIEEGNAVITATLEGVPDQTDVVVTAAVLERIEVDPRIAEVPAGLEVAYSATGFYSNGTSTPINEDVSWISSDPDVAVITFEGVAITQNSGTATITAALDIGEGGIPNIISGSALLVVNSAEVSSIQITPPFLIEPAGTSGQLTATALLSNGATEDITQSATWTSSNTDVVTVGTTGTVGGFTELVKKGVATITVAAQTKSATIPIDVTDAVLVEILVDPVNAFLTEGVELQYNATGVFSDGSATPINTDVSWNSSDNGVATITGTGIATGIEDGVTNISASLNEITTTTPLTVTNPVLVEIQVSPIDTSLVVAQTQQYQATGIYDNAQTQDITSSVTWNSDTEFATISNSSRSSATSSGSVGQLTAIKATPETLVTANLINSNNVLITDSATLEITDPILDFVTIRPGRQTLPKGSLSQWTAEATFTNNDTVDVTNDASWSSSNVTVATVIDGVVFGVRAGTANITTNYQGETDTLPVTVTEPDLTSVVVTPSYSILGPNVAQQMIATATYSDGSNLIVTESSNWFSSSGDVSVSNTSGSKGIATGQEVGTANIAADLDSFVGTDAVVEVQELVVVDLKVSPRVTSMSNKSNHLFYATAIYNGNTEADVTAQVTWTTSNSNILKIENSANGDKKTHGLATAKQEGVVTVTATWPPDPTITDTAEVTVTASCDNGNDPDSIYVKPNPATISVNNQLQFELVRVKNGCEKNETYEKANWVSADEDTVNIVYKSGVATALDLGAVNIDGEFNKDFTEAVAVTVIPEEVSSVSINVEAPDTAVDYEVDVTNGLTVNLTCDMREVVVGVIQPPADITDQATWLSENNSIASLVDIDANPQLVTAVAVGKTDVTCYHGGKRANITINVVP